MSGEEEGGGADRADGRGVELVFGALLMNAIVMAALLLLPLLLFPLLLLPLFVLLRWVLFLLLSDALVLLI